MCEAPAIKEFEHWKIIENEYPYDAVAKVSHMLVPKRHVHAHVFLNTIERNELECDVTVEIIGDDYDAMQWNTPKAQTHPSHYHIHLLTFRRV